MLTGKSFASCPIATNGSGLTEMCSRISRLTFCRDFRVRREMAEQTLLEAPNTVFVERRQRDIATPPAVAERRQFRDGDRSARPEVAELANAIDDYKIAYRRRFITFEELYDVMTSLGYHR
jgi:hypothetical protein